MVGLWPIPNEGFAGRFNDSTIVQCSLGNSCNPRSLNFLKQGRSLTTGYVNDHRGGHLDPERPATQNPLHDSTPCLRAVFLWQRSSKAASFAGSSSKGKRTSRVIQEMCSAPCSTGRRGTRTASVQRLAYSQGVANLLQSCKID